MGVNAMKAGMGVNAMKAGDRAARVLIVDDHPAVREGLGVWIARQPDLELCGEAAEVAQALALFDEASPDVVVVDLSLKGGDGIDLIKRIRVRDDHARILVWSMYPETLYAERALRRGPGLYQQAGAHRADRRGDPVRARRQDVPERAAVRAAPAGRRRPR